MKKLYIKLAMSNIKNSRQFCLPYILTGMLTAAMFYNMVTIQGNEGLNGVPGAGDLKMILLMGVFVIAIFVVIFLFYTNSFIIKRRKKELGVYNILGMEKRHITKVLAAETFITGTISISGGLVTGIVFNKLLMMLLYRLIGFTSTIQFYVSVDGIRMTVILFGAAYIGILFYNMMQVKLSKPVELLHGGNVGEKEPKTKILMTILGLLCIGSGYYIAITTDNPVDAIVLFFVAVVLVIIGTYYLFTAGSIAILKMMRKNKKYYYQANHFTNVSGMIYRMKQNAAGLSNICILSTMVLVMISTTCSMFLGMEDELDSRYPSEISVTGYYDGEVVEDQLLEKVEKQIESSGRTILSKRAFFAFETMVLVNGNIFETESDGNTDFSKTAMLTVLTLDEYQKNYDFVYDGTLKENEVILLGNPKYEYDTIDILNHELQVVQQADVVEDAKDYGYMIIGGYYAILVQNEDVLESLYQEWAQERETNMREAQIMYEIEIEIDGTPEEKIACENALQSAVWDENSEIWINSKAQSVRMEARQMNVDEFYSLYGGLFFLGLFLGILFLMVTVLIIFYKQISEGYEDKERFEIMEKVGMSNAEVKSTIRAQIRMVFFLPIGVAAVHLAAAYPMLTKVLAMLNLTNTALYAVCMLGTVVVFGVIYIVVFMLTSKSYYKIVGNQIKH